MPDAPLDLDALEAAARAAAAAAPGEWVWWHSEQLPLPISTSGNVAAIAEAMRIDVADHIATFDPPTVLQLVARVRALEAARETLRAAVTGLQAEVESCSAGCRWLSTENARLEGELAELQRPFIVPGDSPEMHAAALAAGAEGATEGEGP